MLSIAILGGVAVAGCAQAPQPQQLAAGHGKEYFPSSVYGPASRRVIADGQPIPHGGGQYLVGKPYTVAGQTYYPSERAVRQVGLASWYGDAFHGRLTANGEVYDRDGFTAAHPTMPLPSYARVTNLRNNYTMVVRVNDRGPYHAGRIMDVSRRVAEALDFQRGGTAKIKVEYVGRASLAGSDDAKLYATLRRDGVAGPEERSLLAEAAPAAPARVASLLPFAAEGRRAAEARVEARRDEGDATREEAEARRDFAAARRERDEARRLRQDERRAEVAERRERAEENDRASVRPARPEPAPSRAAEGRRPEGADRRRLAALSAEAPRRAGRAGVAAIGADDGGRRDERGGRRGRAEVAGEAALPPPRPSFRTASPVTGAGRGGEPMPPRRLRLASAEPLRKGGGMRLTRSPQD